MPPKYGAITQYTEMNDNSPLGKNGNEFVQEVMENFVYYDRAIDSTSLTALNGIVAQQSNPMEATMAKVKQFFDYWTMHEDVASM